MVEDKPDPQPWRLHSVYNSSIKTTYCIIVNLLFHMEGVIAGANAVA